MSIPKHYISAQDLLEDSFKLAVNIYNSGFRPELIVGVWRGGTPIAIAVHEYFVYRGMTPDHIAIRAASYTGINSRNKDVTVFGLEYIFEHTRPDASLLIIDDVFDSGNSFRTILEQLEQHYGAGVSDRIRIACPWYKPLNNQTRLSPDYYLHETADWLVFPHELGGLTSAEILAGKTAIGRIIS